MSFPFLKRNIGINKSPPLIEKYCQSLEIRYFGVRLYFVFPPCATTESVVKEGSDLADEIYKMFSSGDNKNKNALGTNVLLSEGFQGMDPLIAVRDCSCKSPLLDSLKKQTEALAKEKGEDDEEGKGGGGKGEGGKG